jgi:hypothetical protein
MGDDTDHTGSKFRVCAFISSDLLPEASIGTNPPLNASCATVFRQ